VAKARKRVAGRGAAKASRSARGAEAAKLINAYVGRSHANLQAVAHRLRRLVKKTVPASRETVNAWGIPTFEYNGPMCLMMVGEHHVTLGFTRGTSLPDDAELLEGTGKNLRHVKLKEVEHLRDANLRQLLLEAAALNEAKPMSGSMRAKKS
jgi:hypothetical protein